jgi:hypothetical protein
MLRLARSPPLGAFPCEREEKGKRKGRPKSRDTYGSRAAQSGGPFFFPRRAPPTTAATTTPASQREHARTARNGARQQAASTGLALASGGGRAFALRRGSKGTEGRRREICLVVLSQKRHAHGGVAWRERIVGATSALPWDGPRIRGNSWNPRSAGWVVDRQWTGLGSEVFSEHTRTGEGEA